MLVSHMSLKSFYVNLLYWIQDNFMCNLKQHDKNYTVMFKFDRTPETALWFPLASVILLKVRKFHAWI